MIRNLFVILFFLLIITSCAKKSAQILEESNTQTWQTVDYTYHIFFGYNFNDPAFIEKTVSILHQTFGAKEDGGLISYSMYPDNYLVGKNTRISTLADLTKSENLKGIISLGAPEGIYVPVTKMQDAGWDYPVYTLFSQEDILASEGISTLVFDVPTKKEDGDDQLDLNLDDVPNLLITLITFMQSNTPLEIQPETRIQIEKLLNNWTVSTYIDAETGIFSSNHFIIQKND